MKFRLQLSQVILIVAQHYENIFLESIFTKEEIKIERAYFCTLMVFQIYLSIPFLLKLISFYLCVFNNFHESCVLLYYYTYKPKRRKLTLLVNKNLIKLAKAKGINLSKFMEHKLKEELFQETNSCGGWDLNPRTPTGRDPESRAFVRSATPAWVRAKRL